MTKEMLKNARCDSVRLLRLSEKKLRSVMRFLELHYVDRSRGYGVWLREGSRAWNAVHRRWRKAKAALDQREAELNIPPKLILGRPRGYGVPENRQICDRIRREHLRPRVSAGLWDGMTAVRPDKTEVRLGDQKASQMGVMLRKGAWPDLYTPEKRVKKHARSNLRES
jgi:hypothetical protein